MGLENPAQVQESSEERMEGVQAEEGRAPRRAAARGLAATLSSVWREGVPDGMEEEEEEEEEEREEGEEKDGRKEQRARGRRRALAARQHAGEEEEEEEEERKPQSSIGNRGQRGVKGAKKAKPTRARNVASEADVNKWDVYRKKASAHVRAIWRALHFAETVATAGSASQHHQHSHQHRLSAAETSEVHKHEDRVRDGVKAILELLDEIEGLNADDRRWEAMADGGEGKEGADNNSSDDSDSGVDVEEISCSRCGNGDATEGNDILLCDRAGCCRAYHQLCLDPPLREIPGSTLQDSEKEEGADSEISDADHTSDDWFCWQCECIDDILAMLSDDFDAEWMEAKEAFTPEKWNAVQEHDPMATTVWRMAEEIRAGADGHVAESDGAEAVNARSRAGAERWTAEAAVQQGRASNAYFMAYAPIEPEGDCSGSDSSSEYETDTESSEPEVDGVHGDNEESEDVGNGGDEVAAEDGDEAEDEEEDEEEDDDESDKDSNVYSNEDTDISESEALVMESTEQDLGDPLITFLRTLTDAAWEQLPPHVRDEMRRELAASDVPPPSASSSSSSASSATSSEAAGTAAATRETQQDISAAKDDDDAADHSEPVRGGHRYITRSRVGYGPSAVAISLMADERDIGRSVAKVVRGVMSVGTITAVQPATGSDGARWTLEYPQAKETVVVDLEAASAAMADFVRYERATREQRMAERRARAMELSDLLGRTSDCNVVDTKRRRNNVSYRDLHISMFGFLPPELFDSDDEEGKQLAREHIQDDEDDEDWTPGAARARRSTTKTTKRAPGRQQRRSKSKQNQTGTSKRKGSRQANGKAKAKAKSTSSDTSVPSPSPLATTAGTSASGGRKRRRAPSAPSSSSPSSAAAEQDDKLDENEGAAEDAKTNKTHTTRRKKKARARVDA